MWATRFEYDSSSKCQLETRLDDQSSRSSYIEKLYRLSDNLSIRFASDFRFKAFDYKPIIALFSIALLRCIIMNIFVLSLLFYLVSYIVFHRCFVDLIYFFSNIELS